MNNRVDYPRAMRMLGENNVKYEIISLGDGFSVIVCASGGRLLGPFKDNGESILWLNAAFLDEEKFAKLLTSKNWNIGGERFWIAPELAFFVKRRKDFDETYVIQTELDPGRFKLSRTDNKVVLEQSIQLDTYELPFKSKRIYMRRSIESAEEIKELKELKEKTTSLEGCGYKQTFTIEDKSPEDEMYLEPWILSQLNPGGRILVPIIGEFDFVDYYDPITYDYQIVHDGFVELKSTGDRKYKVAYKAIKTIGRIAYVNVMEDGLYYALLRSYYNDPSNPYCCEPSDKEGQNGCSLYIYNDFGGNGGFTELENSGLTIGKETGSTRQDSDLVQFLYTGEKSDIEKVIETFLGIKYKIEL